MRLVDGRRFRDGQRGLAGLRNELNRVRVVRHDLFFTPAPDHGGHRVTGHQAPQDGRLVRFRQRWFDGLDKGRGHAEIVLFCKSEK